MELDVKLLPWQVDVWNCPAKYICVAAGRRTGKTEFAAWRLLINALSDGKDGHRFYVAPTQGQARDVMWKKLLQLGHGVISSTHINNLEINLINGQTISLKGADRPETMRGVKLADLVLDEYADMRVYVLEEILMPAMTDLDPGMLIIGSPMGRNHFYDLCKKAELGDDPDWAYFHFTSYDNPTLNRELLEKRKATMSSYAYRQEFLASFEARGSEVFKDEWVKYGSDAPAAGRWYVAVDLAGFEEMGKKRGKGKLDDTAIAVVKINQRGWWVETIISGRWTLDETAKKIFDVVQQYKPIAVGIERGIAKQAVMSPLSDLMRRTGRFFNVRELTHGNKNKIDRIVWALQGRFENGWITLKRDDWNIKFLDQLFQFPDPLTHDDCIDALAYIDQLSEQTYLSDIVIDEFEILDDVAGY
jgi:predicted phage terminase large subunit-like protein